MLPDFGQNLWPWQQKPASAVLTGTEKAWLTPIYWATFLLFWSRTLRRVSVVMVTSVDLGLRSFHWAENFQFYIATTVFIGYSYYIHCTLVLFELTAKRLHPTVGHKILRYFASSSVIFPRASIFPPVFPIHPFKIFRFSFLFSWPIWLHGLCSCRSSTPVLEV